MHFGTESGALAFLRKQCMFKNQWIVFDIDDTLLLRMGPTDVAPIVEMLEFYKYTLSQGARIYIITARPHSVENYGVTLEQLVRAGITTIHGLFLMNSHEIPTARHIADFKHNTRLYIRARESQDVALIVGNHWHDLLAPEFMSSPELVQLSNDLVYVFNAPGSIGATLLLKVPTWPGRKKL